MPVTRFPFGTTNNVATDILGDLPIPDPSKLHVFFDDFDNFPENIELQDANSIEWNIDIDAGGNIAPGFSNVDGGSISLVANATDTDVCILQAIVRGFRMFPNFTEEMWFSARFGQSNTGDTETYALGLSGDSTPVLEPNVGIYFVKQEGSPALELHVKTLTTDTLIPVADIDNSGDGLQTATWYYDGASTLHWGIDGVRLGSEVIGLLPNAYLAPYAGIRAEEAVEKILTVDFLLAVSTRRD